jgi:hypothetical protein
MSRIDKKAVERQAGLFLANLARGALAALILWFILGNLDWYDPWISLHPAGTLLGPRTEFLLEAGDKDTGIKSVRVVVIQRGAEKEVLAQTFPLREGLLGSKGARLTKMEIPFVLDAKALGLGAGKAVLQVTARDHSWRNRFQGRLVTLVRDVVIDLHKAPHAM